MRRTRTPACATSPRGRTTTSTGCCSGRTPHPRAARTSCGVSDAAASPAGATQSAPTVGSPTPPHPTPLKWKSGCVIYQSGAGMCKSVLIDVRHPSCISFNEAFSPFVSALRSPRGRFYVKQPHRPDGSQRFPALSCVFLRFPALCSCQREVACIVDQALLLFCFNKHLQGSRQRGGVLLQHLCRRTGGGGGGRDGARERVAG